MTYQVGQIVAWDCAKQSPRRTYIAVVRKANARSVSVQTADVWADSYTFGAKGQTVGLYGGRWTLREPTKAERDSALCALAQERVEDSISAARIALARVKRDPKIMEAIADRADLLLKTVKGFVK